MRRVDAVALLLVLCGVWGFGATVQAREPTPAQTAAVEAIERLGGGVSPAGFLVPLGYAVSLKGENVTDQDLAFLEPIDGVRVLSLEKTRVRGDGLAHLKPLSHLMILDLSDSQVSDDGLAHLKDLKGLRVLSLDGAPITDAGLVHLRALKGLREITVRRTRLTGSGVESLRRALPRCRVR